MAIIYYPNRIYKKFEPAIQKSIEKPQLLTYQFGKNILGSAINDVISCDFDWLLKSISFDFSNAVARDFYAYVIGGIKVVLNLNDYLWFSIGGTLPKKVTLTAGFYTGAQLASHLQSVMNTAYLANGITFTITYSATTGKFSIVPSGGKTIKYLNVNSAQVMTERDSIAGHLFGFTTDSAYATPLLSDTEVFGLNSEVAFISQAANTATSYLNTDELSLDIDKAIKISSSDATDVFVNYKLIYQKII